MQGFYHAVSSVIDAESNLREDDENKDVISFFSKLILSWEDFLWLYFLSVYISARKHNASDPDQSAW